MYFFLNLKRVLHLIIQFATNNTLTMKNGESGIQKSTLVDDIMMEFGSYTCEDVSLETVKIIYVPADITLNVKLWREMWSCFRLTPMMIEKYGAPEKLVAKEPTLDDRHNAWYKKEIEPAFADWIKRGETEWKNGPYYLCACRESGDEYFVRRALPNDPFTGGKFMNIECRFSEMDDCVPRNRLKQARGDVDGEYLLIVTHRPGVPEDREKLREMLRHHAQ